jgi:hypothetical protein
MKAYHIRTVEKDDGSVVGALTGLGTIDLDSIYVLDTGLVLGFGGDKNKRSDKGMLFCHSSYSRRALSIVKQDDPEVEGEVIGEFDLKPDVYKRIEANRRYHNTFVRGCQVFDGTTKSLVDILSGPLVVVVDGREKQGDRCII